MLYIVNKYLYIISFNYLDKLKKILLFMIKGTQKFVFFLKEMQLDGQRAWTQILTCLVIMFDQVAISLTYYITKKKKIRNYIVLNFLGPIS